MNRTVRNIAEANDIAAEEVVADGMELVLSDGKVLEELAHTDRSIRQKVKAWITNIISKIRKYYGELNQASKTGQVLAETMDSLDDIEQLFYEGVTEAGERTRTAEAGESVEEDGKIVYDLKNAILTLGEYDSTRKRHIESSERDRIVRNYDEIRSFIQNAPTKKEFERIHIGIINPETADLVLEKTGQDIHEYDVVLSNEFIAHIFKQHGDQRKETPRNQIAVTTENIEDLVEAMIDPDDVEPDEADTGPAIKFFKKVGNTNVALTITSKKKGTLTLKSAWIIEESGGRTPSSSADALEGTSKTNGRSSTEDSVAQPDGKVNRKFSISEEKSSDIRYSIDETAESPDVSGEGITVNMREQERAQILQKKTIRPPEIIVPENFDISREDLERNRKSAVEKPLIRKLREMGYLTEYQTNAIDVSFDFTAAGLRKSMNSQVSDYGGNLGDLAKVVMNMQALLDSAVLIDIHSDKGIGNDHENKRLVQVFVMMSAFREETTITPVQFEVKQYVDNDNRLYLAVALTKIETGVMGDTASLDGRRTRLLPVSDISIPQIIEKINPRDEKFFKYIPDEFLNAEQMEAKQRAIAKDEAKYGVKYSVDNTDETAESPDVSENRDLTDRELLLAMAEQLVGSEEEACECVRPKKAQEGKMCLFDALRSNKNFRNRKKLF